MFINMLLGIISLLWAGMILGISFLESWVKFRAPLLTRPVALDVGRTVFKAFHKVQMGILLLLILTTLLMPFNNTLIAAVACLVGIYFFQTYSLLSKLSARADLVIAGKALPKSHAHKLYAMMELAKLLLLIMIAIMGLCNR